MPRSNRLLVATTGGIAFVVIAMGVALYFQPRNSETSSEPSAETQAAPEQNSPAYDGSVTCNANCQVTFGLGDGLQAPSGGEDARQREAEREAAKDRRDLLAQERMAYWAIWLAGFTVTGIALLAGTFWQAMEATNAANRAAKAARKANKTTRQVGEAQVRAYLHAGEGSITSIEGVGDIPFSFSIANTGNSPASDIAFYAMLVTAPVKHDTYPPIRKRLGKLIIKDIAARSQRERDGLIHLGIDYNRLAQDLYAGDLQIFIAGNLVYRDVFKKRCRAKVAVRGYITQSDGKGTHTGVLKPCNPDIWDETKEKKAKRAKP